MENEGGKQYLLAAGIDNSQLKANAEEAIKILKGIGDKAVADGARIDNAYKQASSSMTKEIRENIDIQKKVIADLEEQYKSAKAEFDKLNIGTQDPLIISQRKEASKLFSEIKAELDAEKKGLEDLEKQYQKLATTEKKATESKSTYYTQMRSIREEMTQIIELSKQNGANYKENERYKELEKELQKVATAYRIVQKEQKNLTTAGSQLSGILSGMSGIAGIFTATQGAASLLTTNNEKLLAIQTKLQAAMSITIGLQQVSNTLHQTSAFRMNTVTKATELWKAAQAKLNTQLGISVGLSKALMVSGIGLLLTGISALVIWYQKWKKEQDETNQRLEETRKRQQEFNEKISQGLGKQIAEINAMRAALNAENISRNDKLKIIQKLQDTIPGYTVALNKEGKAIMENKDAIDQYIASLEKSLKFRAAEEELGSIYSRKMNVEMQFGKDFQMYEYLKGLKITPDDKRFESTRNAMHALQASRNTYIQRMKEIDAEEQKYIDYIKKNNLVDIASDKSTETGRSKNNDAERIASDLLKIQQDIEQTRINLEADSAKKRRAQIELDYDKEIALIKSKEKEWRKAQKGELTEEQTTVLTDWTKVVEDKKTYNLGEVDRKEVEELNKLLAKYQTYYQKRLDTIEKFQKDRDKLQNAGASDEQLGELDYQENKALVAIDEEFALREEQFQGWVNSIINLALEDLEKLLNETEEELAKMEAENPADPKLATQRTKVATLQKKISDENNKSDVSPPEDAYKKWQRLQKTLSSVSRQFKEVGDAVGGTVGEIISSAGVIAASTISMIDGIKTLAVGAIDATKNTAVTAANAIKAVEKASVILAIIGAALEITQKMLDLFGGDDTTEKYEKTRETYQSYISILDKVIQKQLELAESLTGNAANAAYDKAIELIKMQSEAARVLGKQYLNSGSSWKSHSKGYDEVDDMSGEGWEQAAKAMGMSISQFKKLMGGRMTGLFDLTEAQLVKLKESAPIFCSQLDSDTKDYADQIVDGVASVLDVIEQKMTDLTGLDIDSLRNDFLDLLNDMDSESKDFAQQFEDYLKNAILNSMLKEQYASRLSAWRERFAQVMDEGTIEQNYNSLKNEAQSLADAMIAERDALAAMFGWETSDERNTSSKGFESMSQDTATELNGRFTAIQAHTFEINENLRLLVPFAQQNNEAVLSIKSAMLLMQSNAERILNHLAGIETNTSRLAAIEGGIIAMKTGIEDINLRGVTIRT